MYDQLAAIYDRFIDWPRRLARELPLLEQHLDGRVRIADVACGTGRHAVALARRGHVAVGFDRSDEALERGRRLAREEGVAVEFIRAGFGEVARTGGGRYDALICLGNSLPHILDRRLLRRSVHDFGRALAPGGLFIAHLRNLPRAAAAGERWLPLRFAADPDGTEWVFERLYDFRSRGRVDFHFVVLQRDPDGSWRRRILTTRLRAWRLDELLPLFEEWDEVTPCADLAGTPFDADSSADLFLFARRP